MYLDTITERLRCYEVGEGGGEGGLTSGQVGNQWWEGELLIYRGFLTPMQNMERTLGNQEPMFN